MVKNTTRRAPQNKDKCATKLISRRDYANLIRSNLRKNEHKSRPKPLPYHRIQEILNEATLQCPICLQTLLKPSLAECGHTFCLTCAQDLAKNDYACGICHDYQPTYDLTVDKGFQELINVYLAKCNPDERLIYEQREKTLQEKEASRGVGKLAAGDFVDFWCVDSKCWKCGMVKDISARGSVCVMELKTSKQIQINILSRRLARHRYYTKEEVVIIDQFTNLVGSGQGGFQRPMGHAAMYNMPLFFNFFDGQEQNLGFGGFDNTDFFGFMPRFRPFPF